MAPSKSLLAEAGDSDVRAVFFDIGNVLLSFNVRRIAAKMAWAVRRHPLQVARYLWHSDIGRRVERGTLSPRRFYEMFCRDLEFEGSYEDFSMLWSNHFVLNRETAEILKKVSARKRVYLLSNTNHLHYEFIRRRYAFVRFVRGAVLSYRLRMRKPEPGIYRAALRRARVRPHQAVFIDDLADNVLAARKLGIQALRYTGAADLERDLTSLGIL